jgi:hypothetical protein
VEASQVVGVWRVALKVCPLERRSLVKMVYLVVERSKQLKAPKALLPALEETCFAEELQEPSVLKPEMEGRTWSSLCLDQHLYSPRRIREKS